MTGPVFAEPRPAPAVAPPAAVRRTLTAPGRPLDTRVRRRMEAGLGHDLTGVRVHTDSAAAESAEAIGAHAYSFGRSVVFGRDRYRPGTPAGDRLIAHELAHVAQSRAVAPDARPTHIGPADDAAEHAAHDAAAAATSGHRAAVAPRPGLAIRLQPTPTPTPVPVLPPFQSFADMWDEFDEHRRNGRDAEAITLARAILGRMSGDEAFEHAADMAVWLFARGQPGLANQALSNLNTALTVRLAVTGALPVTGMYVRSRGPVELIDAAEQEAAIGRHDNARELFGAAFLWLQVGLILFSDRRFESLGRLDQAARNAPPGVSLDNPMIRLLSYHQEADLIALMRRIVAFYPTRRRRGVAAGNTTLATEMETRDRELRDRLRAHWLLLGSGPGVSAITMEATFGVDPRRGPGYTLHGAGATGRSEFVTPLPGEPRPDELGRHPAYSESMEGILATLEGQEALISELTDEPRIRAAFGTRRIDMNDEATRLRVWGIMYGAFQSRQHAPGCSTALCSLLRLMQRYLRFFTTHTGYDVRDMGVSYLASEFPEDLLGRLVRDCGVYALKVAFEVFRTARAATPRLAVSFQIYHSLEHTMMVIVDTAANEHYVVSNNEIIGPRTGYPAGTVARAYGDLMGRGESISIGARTQPLTTAMTEQTFRTEIWARYRAGTHMTLDTSRRDPGDTRTQAQRHEETFTQYYADIARFGRAAAAAAATLDTLSAALGRQARAQHTGLVSPRLGLLTQAGVAMIGIAREWPLDQVVRPPHVGLRPGATRPVERVPLLASAGTGSHPLVRIAKALLYAQSLGTSLTRQQQAIVNWVETQAPWRSFARDIADYRAAGRPPAL